MGFETILAIGKWTSFAGLLIANLSILIGIASPLFSPSGRLRGYWIEFGIEMLSISILEYILYMVLKTFLEGLGII